MVAVAVGSAAAVAAVAAAVDLAAVAAVVRATKRDAPASLAPARSHPTRKERPDDLRRFVFLGM